MGKQPETENDIKHLTDSLRALKALSNTMAAQEKYLEAARKEYKAELTKIADAYLGEDNGYTIAVLIDKGTIAVVEHRSWPNVSLEQPNLGVKFLPVIETLDMGGCQSGCTCSNEPSATSGDSP